VISFEYALGLALALLSMVAAIAWFFFRQEISSLRADIIAERTKREAVEIRLNQLLSDMPLIYARRDDLRDLGARIEKAVADLGDKLTTNIERVYDKLEEKADRPR
jgi:hypothetical protein